MAVQKQCGCKGVRSCILCEPGDGKESYGVVSPAPLVEPSSVFTQCLTCGELLKESAVSNCHVTCTPLVTLRPVLSLPGDSRFDGVSVIQEFVSKEQEQTLIQAIDRQPWAESQSGRRKQDYGPKVNFKRRKVKLGSFSGLPSFSQELVERMRVEVDGLGDFAPVELCNLDYRPERGAAIDPHMDDSWIWGERLVTLNLLSHSILTFTRRASDHTHSLQVEVHMPRCSLIVVSGRARFQWQHSIQRNHVTSRRVAITLRELSAEFSPGGSNYEPMGLKILETASLSVTNL